MLSRRQVVSGALVATAVAQVRAAGASIPRYSEFRPGAVWLDNHGVPINAPVAAFFCTRSVYHWFGEHKIEGEAGNTAQVGVHVYSSKDLYNWRDCGVAPRVSSEPSSDVVQGCIIERPKVLFNQSTGKFVMWFHLERKGQGYTAARAGVAVADHPAGPYTYLHSVRPNAAQWPVGITESEKVPAEGNLLQRDFCGRADGKGHDLSPECRRQGVYELLHRKRTARCMYRS